MMLYILCFIAGWSACVLAQALPILLEALRGKIRRSTLAGIKP